MEKLKEIYILLRLNKSYSKNKELNNIKNKKKKIKNKDVVVGSRIPS